MINLLRRLIFFGILRLSIHRHVCITYTYAQHCKENICTLPFLFAHNFLANVDVSKWLFIRGRIIKNFWYKLLYVIELFHNIYSRSSYLILFWLSAILIWERIWLVRKNENLTCLQYKICPTTENKNNLTILNYDNQFAIFLKMCSTIFFCAIFLCNNYPFPAFFVLYTLHKISHKVYFIIYAVQYAFITTS